ncbi:transposase [Paraburkholderia fungorum]
MVGKQLCEQVEFVCSDMWWPYIEMIALHCPNALVILDRFHIVCQNEQGDRRGSRRGSSPHDPRRL